MILRRRSFLAASSLLAVSMAMGGSVRAALAQEKPIKIALVAPISGPMARAGQLMRIGAELAIEDVNAQGGIKALDGAKLELVVEDAGDRVETAKNAAQRLIAKEPDLLVATGSWSSSLTLAATEATERASLPWMTLSYADQITDRGFQYIIQTVPVATAMAKNAMPTVLDVAEAQTGKRPAKVAIISDSSAASQAFVEPLRNGGFKDLGVDITADEVFTPPLNDATTMVQKLRATRPDFLLLYSTGFPDARLILTKMSEFGLGGGKLPAVTVGVQFASPEMLSATGPELLEGLIIVAPNWTTKAQEDILPDLVKRSGEPWIGQDTISTYGDIMLIRDALERAGSSDRDAFMEALRATDSTDGAADYYLGDRLAFDEKGRRIGGAVGLVQWQGGQPYLIWPEAEALRTPRWPES